MRDHFLRALSVLVLTALAPETVARAQQPKPANPSSAAAPQAAKEPQIAVFAFSGAPKPSEPTTRPKGLPSFHKLSKAAMVKTLQGAQKILRALPDSAAFYLRLYPGHLTDPKGSLELGAPASDRFAVAHYSAQEIVDCERAEVDREYVELTLSAEAGYVYLVDFFVDIGSEGDRDFTITLADLPPQDQTVHPGVSHLTAIFYAQTSGLYKARLRLKAIPDSGPFPSWGPWYFFAVDVTKFTAA